jgi:hypothetical protein
MERQRDYYGELSDMVKIKRVFDEGAFDIGAAYLIKIEDFNGTRAEIDVVPGATSSNDLDRIRPGIISNYLSEDGIVVLFHDFANSYQQAVFVGVYDRLGDKSYLFELRIHIDDITKSIDVMTCGEEPLIEITPMKAKGLTI